MVANRHKVPKKVWSKWTDEARKLFNELYLSMADEAVYTHPKAEPIPTPHWKTISWNAAWMAADMTTTGAKARDYKFTTV